jgi:hypothetical protein
MKRPYGSGQIYEKWGAYYGRWRTRDGQRVNRRLGVKRTRGRSDGLTRAQAEQAMRRLQAEDAARRPIEADRDRRPGGGMLAGADHDRGRPPLLPAESMHRVHVSLALASNSTDKARDPTWRDRGSTGGAGHEVRRRRLSAFHPAPALRGVHRA